MRHDRHFVDDLTTQNAPPVGRLIPLSSIQPDPEQPRTAIGDLSELVASVRDKGVLEPILVRPSPGSPGNFSIISGERRYRAALEAGMFEIPAIEMQVSESEALEIALVENLQREDLTPFDEAEGYRALAERHDYTHEAIANAVGKSRTTVTEALGLLRMPSRVRECVNALGIENRSILLEVLKLESEEQMLQLLEKVSALGLAREAVRKEVQKARRKPGARAKPYSFSFAAPDKRYKLSLSFRQSTVEPEDLVKALEEALERVRSQIRDV
jgi:ParB family chromosome partitioning protein